MDPSDTDTTDRAVACEFTPSSTQYTPHDGVSEVQTNSGNINLSTQSVDGDVSNGDPMTDFLGSNLMSPQFAQHMMDFFAMSNGEEPNSVHPTSGYSQFDDITVPGQQVGSRDRSGAWHLHSKLLGSWEYFV